MIPKLLGIPPYISTKPLTEALRTNDAFQLVEEPRPSLAKQLREQELNAALLSPLEYAKDSSDYCIVPKVGAVSEIGNGSIAVRFHEGGKKIQTLAVNPLFVWEIVLTKIVFAEAFDIDLTIVPMNATPEVMLQKAGAALFVGDSAVEVMGTDSIIDITEEWNQLTGLPLVHAIWCGRAGDLTNEDITQLQQSALKGTSGINDIVLAALPDDREALQRFLESFSYEMNDGAEEGLAEMMKYFYYHGITPDVSELNFYKPEDGPKDDLLSDISPN